jgi:SAM-dependent methyltransferase
MPQKLRNLLKILKAAADPTRLRLLALLEPGELTVGEITQILKQSQPRVSRHLKLLCDAGLLERFKEEHCVYYRLRVLDAPTLRLHEALDANDADLRKDRERREVVVAERARRATDRLAERTTVAAVNDPPGGTVGDLLVRELAAEPVGALLDIGTGAGFLLKTLAPVASRAVGVDQSTDALRLARSHVQRAGLGQCVLRRGDLYKLSFRAAEFDTVTLGRVLSHAQDPAGVLAEALRVLRPGGRLVLLDEFDALETAAGRNPLAGIRRWLQDRGFRCERIRPIDTGESHFLLTIARRPLPLEEAA